MEAAAKVKAYMVFESSARKSRFIIGEGVGGFKMICEFIICMIL